MGRYLTIDRVCRGNREVSNCMQSSGWPICVETGYGGRVGYETNGGVKSSIVRDHNRVGVVAEQCFLRGIWVPIAPTDCRLTGDGWFPFWIPANFKRRRVGSSASHPNPGMGRPGPALFLFRWSPVNPATPSTNRPLPTELLLDLVGIDNWTGHVTRHLFHAARIFESGASDHTDDGRIG